MTLWLIPAALAGGTLAAIGVAIFAARGYDRGRRDGYREGVAAVKAQALAVIEGQNAECQQILTDFMDAQRRGEVRR